MQYQFRPATRSQAKPLIGIYSESGCGKTYSALVLARGFVGPEGRIGMIETESGRGEAYADPAEYPEIGGYEVLPLRDNFSPKVYGEAIAAAEKAKLDALIIDSASHEWEGAGGVLSMAAANQERGDKAILAWQKPKMLHQQLFMLKFMQTPIPLVIVCMRAKYPMREQPKSGGGKEWVRSEVLEPKQADDILFEMFIHGWISHGDHVFHLTRCTAKALEPVFGGNRPISVQTGRDLAAWAVRSAGTASSSDPDPVALAKAAADHGVEHFRAWWAGDGRAHRDALRSHLPDLQKRAQAADAAAAGQADDEDPFAGAAEAGSGEAERHGDIGGEAEPDLPDAVSGDPATGHAGAPGQMPTTESEWGAWLAAAKLDVEAAQSVTELERTMTAWTTSGAVTGLKHVREAWYDELMDAYMARLSPLRAQSFGAAVDQSSMDL